MSDENNVSAKLKSLALYPLPHHLVSRVIFKLTRMQSPLTTSVIRWFVKQFDVDMKDSKVEDLTNFDTFNAFFTRELKSTARPITDDLNAVACPADGRISQLGDIDEGLIMQAKKHDYTVQSLLAGSSEEASHFNKGSFATVYLSPRDYHRIHMPVTGVLRSMTHVPGRLFSVAPHTVANVPSLFARNERVVAMFDSEYGKLAMVLVGAINVAAIETVWEGLVTPPAGKSISTKTYTDADAIELQRGAEMGRFNMGSTVIMLFEKRLQWAPDLVAGSPVVMGQRTDHAG